MPLFNSGAPEVQESSPFAQAEKAQQLVPDLDTELEAQYQTGPAAMIGRAFQRELPFLQGKTLGETYDMPSTLNKRYGVPDGQNWFTQPLPDSIAQVIAQQKKDEAKRNEVLGAFEQGHNFATNFGVGTLGFLADPIDAASMFVPGLGEDAIMAKVGANVVGKVAGRLAVGAEAGAVSMAPVSVIKGATALDDEDYNLRQGLNDVFFGAALGAGGHALLGTGAEALKSGLRATLGRVAGMDAKAKSDAMRGGIADIILGHPIDTPDRIMDNEDPAEFARRQQNSTEAGPTNGLPRGEAERAHEAVYSRDEEVEPLQPEKMPAAPKESLVKGEPGLPANQQEHTVAETPEAKAQAAAILAKPEVQAEISSPRVIDRTHDVPGGAGSSTKGGVTYIDKDIPKLLMVKMEGPAGPNISIDPAKYLNIHEQVEHALMSQGGMAYHEAHFDHATVAEHEALRADGIDPVSYERALEPYLNKVWDEKVHNPPDDLYLKPYPHDKARLLEEEGVKTQPATGDRDEAVGTGEPEEAQPVEPKGEELEPEVQQILNELRAMGPLPIGLMEALADRPNYSEAYLQAIECTAGAVIE